MAIEKHTYTDVETSQEGKLKEKSSCTNEIVKNIHECNEVREKDRLLLESQKKKDQDLQAKKDVGGSRDIPETYAEKQTRYAKLLREQDQLGAKKTACKQEMLNYEKSHHLTSDTALKDMNFRKLANQYSDLDYAQRTLKTDSDRLYGELREAKAKGADTVEKKALVPGTPGEVTGGDAQELKRNICKEMGLPEDMPADAKKLTEYQGIKESEAHHLIPKSKQFKEHPVLKEIGMNLDDASNGILLPKYNPDGLNSRTIHRGWHTTYSKVVLDRLDKLNDASLTTAQKRQGVADLQKDLRTLLENGTPIYKAKRNESARKKEFKAYKAMKAEGKDVTFKSMDVDYKTRGGGATYKLIDKKLNEMTTRREAREGKEQSESQENSDTPGPNKAVGSKEKMTLKEKAREEGYFSPLASVVYAARKNWGFISKAGKAVGYAFKVTSLATSIKERNVPASTYHMATLNASLKKSLHKETARGLDRKFHHVDRMILTLAIKAKYPTKKSKDFSPRTESIEEVKAHTYHMPDMPADNAPKITYEKTSEKKSGSS